MAETATSRLRAEHSLIIEVVAVLERILQSDDLDFDSIELSTSFFRLFVDACHHSEEEDLLFPSLADHGMEGDDGPIAVMLAEHRQGRALVKRMADSLPGAAAGGEAAIAELRDAARSYIDLIRAHIAKEDGVLFTLADEMVTGAACETLCSRYEAACLGRLGGKTKQQVEELGNELLARYPAP